MKRFCIILLAAGFLFVGCRPRTAAPPAPAPSVSNEVALAVLLFEDSLEDAQGSATGTALYRAQVEGLTQALRAAGKKADTVVIPPDGVDTFDLSAYGVAYVVDASSIPAPVGARLESFVQAGGVLVGVYDVGVPTEGGSESWPLAGLFGLRVLRPGEGGAAWAQAPAGSWTFADVVAPDSPLAAGLGARLDWGPVAGPVRPVAVAGADLIAQFPVPSDVATAGATPLPAVTRHTVGRGQAVWVSVLPTGRQFAGWEQAPGAVRLLARAALHQLHQQIGNRLPASSHRFG